MTPSALWQRYQDWLYYLPDLEFYLDLSRVGFSDADLETLRPALAQAFAAMADLEAGGIANPDEHRMVGHYWLRAPDLAPTAEIAQAIRESVDRIEAFAQQVHQGSLRPAGGTPRFTDILSIGIGGSALGPQFVSEALAPLDSPLRLHFIDNTDPEGIDRVLTRLGDALATTLVLVISKSGGTPEPRNAMLEVQRACQNRGYPFPAQAVAITMPGSHLDQVAREGGWLARLPMFDWVGGRTSELSAVGLVPAALQGIPIREMLAGAAAMDAATRVPDLRQNPAAGLAFSWYVLGEGRGKRDMVILPYKDRLALLSRYLQQLVMESLGKAEDLAGRMVHQGIAVYGNKGSTDQHAYVQQLRDGLNNFFATFIEVLQDRQGPSLELEPGITSGDYLSGFLQGTRQALYENGRPSITVTLPAVTPRTVGALIALFERAVGLYGTLINVNAYHQPGVEAGKKAAATILTLQQRLLKVLHGASAPLSLEALAQQAEASAQIETVYWIVRHLAANQRLRLQGDPGRPASLSVSLEP